MLYLQLIIGLIAILIGANYLVDSAVVIAKKFRIPDMVIGMTLVALGTSAPEITVSLVGATKGLSDIALGNVIGSNICNILLVLGVTTLIFPLSITRQNRLIDIPGVLFLTILTLIIGRITITEGNLFAGDISFTLSRFGGIILLLAGILFLLYSYLMTKKEASNNEENSGEVPLLFKSFAGKKSLIPIALLVLLISSICLVWGGNLFVNSAKGVAKLLGMSEMAIAVTIVAIGTSLPELSTSVVAAFKKNSGIALGNIIGSNVINLSFALGGSAVINSIASKTHPIHLHILIISALLLLFFAMLGKKKLSRVSGIILFALYIFYILITLK